MMDPLYREVSLAFPGRAISRIDVCQETDTYRILRIKFRDARSESLFRSFLHKRHQVAALVETCLHDAEDMGLTLPYEQVNALLLAASKDLGVKSTDQVLVLRGAGEGPNNSGIRPSQPGIEGCLLRVDDVFKKLIPRSKMHIRAASSEEPITSTNRNKMLSVNP
jgi:hypothetical protein